MPDVEDECLAINDHGLLKYKLYNDRKHITDYPISPTILNPTLNAHGLSHLEEACLWNVSYENKYVYTKSNNVNKCIINVNKCTIIVNTIYLRANAGS